MTIPDLRMRCLIKTCPDPYNQVERRAPQVWMCALHWQVHLDRQRVWEEKQAAIRSERVALRVKEAHELAVQTVGFVRSPLVRPYTGVHEVNGGLPSLGKAQ